MKDLENEKSQDGEDRQSRFGRFHARTYEMELLVSGAVVFGLFHIPPVLGRWITSFRAGLDGNVRLIGTLGPVYLQLVLFVLIAAFVLHLAMRGFWIGLLGLESVFPNGIRWQRLKLGPATINQYRKRVSSLGAAIDRIDDLCSLIFSFGFLIAFTFVYSVIVIAVVLAVAFGFSWIFMGGRGVTVVFWCVLALVIVIQQLAQSVDKAFGRRVRPGGIAEKLIRRMVNVSYVISPMRLIGATQLTLGSNLSGNRFGVAILVSVSVLGIAHLSGTFLRAGVVRFDSLSFFPDTLLEQGVDPRHYRSLRESASVEPMIPTIQAEVVTGAYLKVFIPYVPSRHDHRVTETCPGLEAVSNDGFDIGRARALEDSQVEEAAACLGSLFKMSLDEDRMEGLRFDFTVEPATGLEGIVTFIPISKLPVGRHELQILVPQRSRLRPRPEEPSEPVRHLIPFWK